MPMRIMVAPVDGSDCVAMVLPLRSVTLLNGLSAFT